MSINILYLGILISILFGCTTTTITVPEQPFVVTHPDPHIPSIESVQQRIKGVYE